jgi:Flp pilus assembly protein TadD
MAAKEKQIGLTHRQAAELLQRVLTFDPLNAGAYRGLTWVHIQAGDIAGAELAAKKAIELNPRATFTHWWMGVVYLMQGRLDKAKS